MSDWQAGDIALCVSLRHRRLRGVSRRLRKGAHYTVTRVFVSNMRGLLAGEVALMLAEVHPLGGPERGWPSSLFIKVTPSPELIAEERQAGVLV